MSAKKPSQANVNTALESRDKQAVERAERQEALQSLVHKWQNKRGFGEHLTSVHRIAAQVAQYGPWPEQLSTSLRDAVRNRGIVDLFSHQAQAVTSALAGQNTVVVTPTASGKSLCYHLPIFDALERGGNALYLFPTKALSQDQTADINTWISNLPQRRADWEAQVYDGDTPADLRRRVRQSSRLVVTNPDMLHAAILPHHAKWIRFFERLDYVVIDELHTYRGVFGSHVGNVIRRLRRICSFYGANPTFIATSATIANPRELAEQLVGDAFELVDNNGAPCSERYLCFYNPAVVDLESMRRQSALSAARQLAEDMLSRELGTIVFTRSRQSVEVLIHHLQERLRRRRYSPHLHRRVASYRGGYLPNLRREIERGLRDGSLLGVVSTNALELGIDIGSLDVCILAGYPGTVASTWQQVGRSGRQGGTSLSVLIATDDPLDQFVVQHPDYFLGSSPEQARIDPDNLRIIVEHLKCACFELPWRQGEVLGGLSSADIEEVFGFLRDETGMVECRGGHWRWAAQTYPATEVNLRNIAEENFVVIDVTAQKPRVIAEVDFESAHTTLYPNAVYQVSGVCYRVEKLAYDQRRAYVRRSNDEYYTTAMHYAAVRVLDVFAERQAGRVEIGFGEVCVTQRFVGYKKLRFKTGENVGYGELHLPELDLHSMAYWITLPTSLFPEQDRFSSIWAHAVQGLSQVLRTAAALRVMCDPRDIDMCIGSLQEDLWLTETWEGLGVRDSSGELHRFNVDSTPGQGEAAMATPHAIEAQRVGPIAGDPTIFIYDRFPGGVGFGEGLFEHHQALLELARDLVQGCSCERGCPSCVGPSPSEDLNVRAKSAGLLGRILDAQALSKTQVKGRVS